MSIIPNRLRALAKSCGFCNEACLNENLLEQIIEGLLDRDIAQELLDAPDLSLEMALEICSVSNINGPESLEKTLSEGEDNDLDSLVQLEFTEEESLDGREEFDGKENDLLSIEGSEILEENMSEVEDDGGLDNFDELDLTKDLLKEDTLEKPFNEVDNVQNQIPLIKEEIDGDSNKDATIDETIERLKTSGVVCTKTRTTEKTSESPKVTVTAEDIQSKISKAFQSEDLSQKQLLEIMQNMLSLQQITVEKKDAERSTAIKDNANPIEDVVSQEDMEANEDVKSEISDVGTAGTIGSSSNDDDNKGTNDDDDTKSNIERNTNEEDNGSLLPLSANLKMRKLLRKNSDGISESTINAYEKSWTDFVNFTQASGEPTKEDYLKYLRFLFEGKKTKTSTIW